jgi:DNA-directed RNA polymerase specialized sigma24 family protein
MEFSWKSPRTLRQAGLSRARRRVVQLGEASNSHYPCKRASPAAEVNMLDQLRCAYDEFKNFYAKERCPWAPENPWRVYRLATKKLFMPTYQHRMTVWEFLSCVYHTLGVREGRLRGLFQDFNPARYTQGELSAEKHFLNMFMKRLRARLHRSLHPRSDNRRKDRHARFVATPALGLVQQEGPGAPTANCQDMLPFLADRPWPPKGFSSLSGTVSEALESLPDSHRTVIELAYWPRLRPSNRRIGRALGLDHKTVGRRRDEAIRMLRAFYADELKNIPA